MFGYRTGHQAMLKKIEFENKLNSYVNPQRSFEVLLPVALWSMLRVRCDSTPPSPQQQQSVSGELKMRYTCSQSHFEEDDGRWTTARSRCELTYQILRLSGTLDEYVVRYHLKTYRQKCRNLSHNMVTGEAQLNSLIKLIHRFTEMFIAPIIDRQIIVNMPRKVYLVDEGKSTLSPNDYEVLWNIKDIPQKGLERNGATIIIPWWDHHDFVTKLAANDEEMRLRKGIQPRRGNYDPEGQVGHIQQRCEACQEGKCQQTTSDRPEQYLIKTGIVSRPVSNELQRLLRSMLPQPQQIRAEVPINLSARMKKTAIAQPSLGISMNTGLIHNRRAEPSGQFKKIPFQQAAFAETIPLEIPKPRTSINSLQTLAQVQPPPTVIYPIWFSGFSHAVGGMAAQRRQEPQNEENEENDAFVDDETDEEDEAFNMDIARIASENARIKEKEELELALRLSLSDQSSKNKVIPREPEHRDGDMYSDEYLFEDPLLRPKPDSDYPDYYLFEGIESV